jgi:hypothetical protein
MEKILVENIFCSKIFFLQNHFLGNSLDEKNLGRKFFLVKIFFFAKSFPWKEWMKKILVDIFLCRKFCYKIISSES